LLERPFAKGGEEKLDVRRGASELAQFFHVKGGEEEKKRFQENHDRWGKSVSAPKARIFPAIAIC